VDSLLLFTLLKNSRTGVHVDHPQEAGNRLQGLSGIPEGTPARRHRRMSMRLIRCWTPLRKQVNLGGPELLNGDNVWIDQLVLGREVGGRSHRSTRRYSAR